MRAVFDLSPFLLCFTVASRTEPQAGLLAAASSAATNAILTVH